MQATAFDERDNVDVRDYCRLKNSPITTEEFLATSPVTDQEFPIH